MAFHCITVKWHVEMFKSEPMIFQCVPFILPHLCAKSQ
jgi:hypothetical protein